MEERIKRPLAEALLFGQLAEGGVARVDANAGNLTLTFTAPPAVEPSAS
jgi:hypothetical protein